MDQSGLPEPRIVRHPIAEIEIFEVAGDKLEALEDTLKRAPDMLEAVFATETRTLGCLSSTLSVFVTATVGLIGLLTAGTNLPPLTLSVVFTLLLSALAIASLGLTVWFGLSYKRASQERLKRVQEWQQEVLQLL